MPLDTPPRRTTTIPSISATTACTCRSAPPPTGATAPTGRRSPRSCNRLGNNAARRGGHAYAINGAHTFAIDARTLTALAFASRVHLAYYASEWQRPYLRLAARHCDLLYGETLQPAPEGTLRMEAQGGREPWWRRYVRVLEPAPGKRIYLVHLINPPEKPGIDAETSPRRRSAPACARLDSFPKGGRPIAPGSSPPTGAKDAT